MAQPAPLDLTVLLDLMEPLEPLVMMVLLVIKAQPDLTVQLAQVD